jgi:ribulose kinase
MVPEFWLTEGGRGPSATGALLDYIIENHVAAPLLSNRGSSKYVSCFLRLVHHYISCLYNHVKGHNFLLKLSRHIHI